MVTIPPDAASLPSGAAMPLLGFGTWQLTGATCVDATTAALDAGYRHVDTATIYRNESEVGRALAGRRDGVFVTSKIPPDRAGEARAVLERSLTQLGVDALDLWLIHGSGGGRADIGLWRSMLQAREEGLVRDVGVSNYRAAQIDELTRETGVTPGVNQIRWSPKLHDPAVVDAHKERGVVLEGYSGLKGGVLDSPTVLGIAERLGVTPAQVLIRWHVEHGIVVIPRSSKPERVRENGDVGGFTLTADDVQALDGLS
jgi:2,5-diketo-D-gluconate reductase A